MGIIGKLLGGGDNPGNGFETVSPEENTRGPVHNWFSEDAFAESDAGVHPEDTGPDYGAALEEGDPLAYEMLDSVEMDVTEDMRDLIRDGYRVVKVDNGEESMRAAYLAWEDNIDEAFGDLLGQATYRTKDNEVILPEGSIERAVDTMYEAVHDLNEELREEEDVDAIGGRRNSSVKASSRAARYDSRKCMNDNSMIGWGEPGVSSHIGFSIKRIDRRDLPYGTQKGSTKRGLEEEVMDRLDFYKGRAYDQDETVRGIGEEFKEIFDAAEEVEVTVDRKHRTDSVDRIMMDDTQVYDGESFTYETIDWTERRRGGGIDRGLREFDRIAEIVERDQVHEYQEA